MLVYGEMMGYVYVTVGSFIGICTYTHTHTHTHIYCTHQSGFCTLPVPCCGDMLYIYIE